MNSAAPHRPSPGIAHQCAADCRRTMRKWALEWRRTRNRGDLHLAVMMRQQAHYYDAAVHLAARDRAIQNGLSRIEHPESSIQREAVR
jgi:hypothetical protein